MQIGNGGYQCKHGVCKRRERVGGLLNLGFATHVANHSILSICPDTLDPKTSMHGEGKAQDTESGQARDLNREAADFGSQAATKFGDCQSWGTAPDPAEPHPQYVTAWGRCVTVSNNKDVHSG